MQIAHEVCRDFLKDVVIGRVFSEAELTRGDGPLDEDRRRDIARGVREDTRSPALTRISGKGGWSPDAGKRESYAVFTNVTLLDHLTSVVRGALQFAEMDLTAGRQREDDELRRRLAVVAAVAFLHDADKMLGMTRQEALDASAVSGLIGRFGIDAFLHKHGAVLSPAQMLVLIDDVEVTRSGRLEAVPREYLHDRYYVRLADRLDGIFLKTRPTKPKEAIGIAGVLHELARFAELDTDAVRLATGDGWRVLELHDPHTPFLLDAFQAALSAACRERHGIPPLIETHHDGQLLVVVPKQQSDAVIAQALGRITRQLGARIRVATNARGKVDLLDAPGKLDDLRDCITTMQARERESVLRAGIDALREHGTAIDAFLGPVGFLPRMPDLTTYPGRLVPVWTGTAGAEEGFIAVHQDAAMINAVLSCDEPPARLGVPDAAQRERELREKMIGLPRWLDDLPQDTRRTLLSAYAAAAARSDAVMHETLLGPEGLVALWLEGCEGRPGLAAKIAATGTRLRSAVEAHFLGLLAGKFVAGNEDETGRCHFTNAPVPRSARIDGKTGLYGVNVSAFSGREGRPESFRSTEAETLVSPIAEAEHRLRKLDYEQGGRSADRRKVPVRVTSPTTAGLFGALPYANDSDVGEYALSDVLRAKIAPDRLIFRNADAVLRRIRIARFEDMPTGMTGSGTEPGQIAFVAMAFTAAQRTGRPVHVFRGLPRPQPEFVAFDAMPQAIALLLGGSGFRLEQIPRCLTLLRGVEAVVEATGFGQELALRICDPNTRFGAACDALARAESRLGADNADRGMHGIRTFATNLLGDPEIMTSKTDRALVAFGQAMALAQRIPIRSDGGNVAELGLRSALDTAEALERMGQTGDESLVAGIAGGVAELLSRRSLVARGELRGGRTLSDVIEAAARVFVDDVWHGAFSGAVPSSRDRRVALATYRFAFQREAAQLRTRAGIEVENDDTAAEEKELAEQA